MRLKFTIGCLFLLLHSFAQSQSSSVLNANQEKIKDYLQNYFGQDRENIHVQFNKNSYINNEKLVFKGYVLSKQSKNLHKNTTNVQLVIYDAKQNIVQKQLLYTTKGTFTGGIQLDEKIKSGLYTFRFFTNWMNNFREDDSFTQTIEIIDKNEPYYLKSNEPNWKTAKLTFFPEGGNIIDGINNTVGVKIIDCNQKGIELKDIAILDSKSNEICRFSTNKMGNGVFYFIPDLNEKYTLKINSTTLNLSQELPQVKETGIILSYNNKFNDRVAIAIRTNEKGVALYDNKKFTILIQQDQMSIIKNIAFENKEPETIFILNKNVLFNGVNSIRLIDENLNEICERLIYKYPETKPSTTLEAKLIANDSIRLSAKSEVNQANLSISVLPEKNSSINQKRSILGTFYLNAYLENAETDNYSYYDPENKNRILDMELLMLNQIHSKFSWENIKSNPPKINYPFEVGVTLNGTVEKNINPNSKFRISLASLKDNVFDETPVDKNGAFKFDNFYARDSTLFIFQMLNEKNAVVKTKIATRVSRNENPFSFPLHLNESTCPIEKKDTQSILFINPKSNNKTIELDEIQIKNNYKKTVLTHENEMGMNATGYKIEDNDFGNVLDFLGMHGFRTGIDPEENTVYIQSNRGMNSGSTASSPSIYIDNNIVFDINLLFDINLQDVDEIYIDHSGSSDTAMSSSGTIKIFLKLDRYKKDYFNINYNTFIVTKGFAKDIEFENTEFETQQAFYNFGTLYWSPNILINESPNFEIKFPRGNQNEVQVWIEGINNTGQMISEMRTIPVLTP